MGYLKYTKMTVNFLKKIPCRGKWVICVQFGPKLQHLAVFFLRHCSIVGHNSQKIVVLVNFPKKSPFQAKEESGPNSVQNYLILYLMICQRVFLKKHFGMIGHDRLKKVVLVIFPQKSSFSTIVQFRPNMGQNYATLCPRQLYLMIHSLKILKCSMMGYNSQTKVLLVNLPKKFSFRLRAISVKFVPNLCNLMSHDSPSEDLFEALWHHEVQKIGKISLFHFSKNLLLGEYWPNLAENYTILYHITSLEIFRNILA